MFKNIDVINLLDAIDNCKDLPGARFGYGLSKNADILRREVEAINSTMKPTKEFEEYTKKRIALAKKYSKKEAGDPIMKTRMVGDRQEGYYDMDEKTKPEWAKEYEALKKENKKVLDAREKQQEDFQKFLEEPATKLKFHLIKFADVPTTILVGQQMGISQLLEDEKK